MIYRHVSGPSVFPPLDGWEPINGNLLLRACYHEIEAVVFGSKLMQKPSFKSCQLCGQDGGLKAGITQ